jgi:hypothetical protein
LLPSFGCDLVIYEKVSGWKEMLVNVTFRQNVGQVSSFWVSSTVFEYKEEGQWNHIILMKVLYSLKYCWGGGRCDREGTMVHGLGSR